MVAITSGKHLGTTLAILEIQSCLVSIIPETDARRGACFMSKDGGLYRIYTRQGRRTGPKVQRGIASCKK